MNILLDILINQEKILKENEEMKEKIQDLFSAADSNGALQPYVKDEVIEVRDAVEDEEIKITWPGSVHKVKHAVQGEYVIRLANNTNAVNLITKKELEKEYELDQVEEKPDAEGFVSYRPKGQILAFEYNEKEPLKLKDNNGTTVNVKFGDYLGYSIDDDTTLIHLDKNHFESSYRLAD